MKEFNSYQKGNFFAVLEFEDGVQVVPRTWVSGYSYLYPAHLIGEELKQAVEQQITPDVNWALISFTKSFGVYNNLEEANERAQSMVYTSKKNSEEKQQEKREVKHSLSYSDSHSDSICKKQRLTEESVEMQEDEMPISQHTDDCSAQPNTEQKDIEEMKRDIKMILEYLRKLTRDVAKLKYETSIAYENTEMVYRRQIENEATTSSSNNMQNREVLRALLPVDSQEELLNLENVIEEKGILRTHLIQHLKNIGGTNAEKVLTGILSTIFTTRLATVYNWEGRKGKFPLRGRPITEFIFDCFMDFSPKSNRKMAELRMREWFRHARDRLKSEEKRSRVI